MAPTCSHTMVANKEDIILSNDSGCGGRGSVRVLVVAHSLYLESLGNRRRGHEYIYKSIAGTFESETVP
jgi:hypothetical protein